VKRDDLTGFGLSGNKVRKLDFLLADAKAKQADTVITCGGIQSNHCRATVVASRRLGLKSVVLLRGAPPENPDGNLLLMQMLGASIQWVDSTGYSNRDAIMLEISHSLRSDGAVPYIIPEGGSNALGALGFVRAGKELSMQSLQLGIRFDSVVCAVGSGGTLAGLAMSGIAGDVVGVAVCDDRDTFRNRVQDIAIEAKEQGLSLSSSFDVMEGFQGRGYALTTPAELECQMRMMRETGLFLDPVYTGKAWFALEKTLIKDRKAFGDRVLFWHTGGTFGLFGRGHEYAPLLGSAG